MQAENDENAIMKRIALLDPLQGLEKGSPINLPLTAFCYLVRRLAVSLSFIVPSSILMPEVDMSAILPRLSPQARICLRSTQTIRL